MADEVARRWPNTRVLLMSGYPENVVNEEGHLAPGLELLAKPFRKIDLAQRVRRVLDGAAI